MAALFTTASSCPNRSTAAPTSRSGAPSAVTSSMCSSGAIGPERVDDCLSEILLETVDDDARALGDGALGDRLADAGATARDDDDLAVETHESFVPRSPFHSWTIPA